MLSLILSVLAWDNLLQNQVRTGLVCSGDTVCFLIEVDDKEGRPLWVEPFSGAPVLVADSEWIPRTIRPGENKNIPASIKLPIWLKKTNAGTQIYTEYRESDLIRGLTPIDQSQTMETPPDHYSGCEIGKGAKKILIRYGSNLTGCQNDKFDHIIQRLTIGGSATDNATLRIRILSSEPTVDGYGNAWSIRTDDVVAMDPIEGANLQRILSPEKNWLGYNSSDPWGAPIPWFDGEGVYLYQQNDGESITVYDIAGTIVKDIGPVQVKKEEVRGISSENGQPVVLRQHEHNWELWLDNEWQSCGGPENSSSESAIVVGKVMNEWAYVLPNGIYWCGNSNRSSIPLTKSTKVILMDGQLAVLSGQFDQTEIGDASWYVLKRTIQSVAGREAPDKREQRDFFVFDRIENANVVPVSPEMQNSSLSALDSNKNCQKPYSFNTWLICTHVPGKEFIQADRSGLVSITTQKQQVRSSFRQHPFQSWTPNPNAFCGGQVPIQARYDRTGTAWWITGDPVSGSNETCSAQIWVGLTPPVSPVSSLNLWIFDSFGSFIPSSNTTPIRQPAYLQFGTMDGHSPTLRLLDLPTGMAPQGGSRDFWTLINPLFTGEVVTRTRGGLKGYSSRTFVNPQKFSAYVTWVVLIAVFIPRLRKSAIRTGRVRERKDILSQLHPLGSIIEIEEFLIGLDKERERIHDTLKTGGHIVWWGAGRTGKSSLMVQVANRLCDEGFSVVYLTLRASGVNDFDTLLRRAVRKAGGAWWLQYPVDQWADINPLTRLLEQNKKNNKRTVLLIDEFQFMLIDADSKQLNVSLSTWRREFRHNLQTEWADLGVGITGIALDVRFQDTDKMDHAGSTLGGILRNRIEIASSFTEAQTDQLVENSGRIAKYRLSDEARTAVMVRCRRLGFQKMEVQRLFHELVNLVNPMLIDQEEREVDLTLIGKLPAMELDDVAIRCPFCSTGPIQGVYRCSRCDWSQTDDPGVSPPLICERCYSETILVYPCQTCHAELKSGIGV